METLSRLAFWFSAGMVTLPLAVYPAALWFLGLFRCRRRFPGFSDLPYVSCLVAARNEGDCIGGRIENLLGQEYPSDRLEIIVGSDASTDATDQVVLSYSGRGVILHRSEVRLGKSDLLTGAKERARGDILVMTDANTVFRSDTVLRLVEPFCDPSVGCVDGSRRNSLSASSCESAYWRYETWLKTLCGRLGAVLGTTGAVFALRRECHRPAGPGRADDFELGVMVRLQGMKCVFNPEAVAYEPSDEDSSQYRRMVRIVAQYAGMAVRFLFAALSRGKPLLALQILLHKVLRWQIGVFALLATVSLIPHAGKASAYGAMAAAAAGFHLMAILGLVFRRRLPGIFLLPYYFWLMGISSIHGMVRLAFRGPTLLWDHEPRK